MNVDLSHLYGSQVSLPNIIFILADDQGSWAMGCAGNAEIQTPNLDRLAQTGTRFDNFFCASPVCSPARASILTGRIPSQHGIHDWLRGGNAIMENELETVGELTEYLQGQPGYTDSLAQAGYSCGLSGKWHLGDSHHPQKSFTYWQPHALGGGPYYNAPVIREGKVVLEPSYITDYITENGLEFLQTHHGQQVNRQSGSFTPFYLSLHYTAPHSPWDREHHPHEIYDEYFENCAFSSIPLEPMHPLQVNSAPCGYTEASRRPLLSGYFTAISAMDRGIGRILDWLEENGLREDTLVIFSSDNGMNMGQHGIFGKGNGTFPLNMFDTSVKVPMLISRPGHIPQGVVNTDPLSHYDLYPTLLDYIGVPNPREDVLPGISFASLLKDGEPIRRDAVVVYDEYGPTRMIRSQDYKYIHRYPYGPHEFYDLREDPGERHNLIGDRALHNHPVYPKKIQELKADLEAWFVRYADPQWDGAREPVTGKGQLTWAGAAGKGRKAFADDWRYLKDDLA
jgi:choline-sulfatase